MRQIADEPRLTCVPQGYMDQITARQELTTMAVIKCRLHQRGDGWATLQQRYLEQRTAVDGTTAPVLVERNVLERPGEEDVVVIRYFNCTDEEVPIDT